MEIQGNDHLMIADIRLGAQVTEEVKLLHNSAAVEFEVKDPCDRNSFSYKEGSLLCDQATASDVPNEPFDNNSCNEALLLQM